jgi:hypothetical protein
LTVLPPNPRVSPNLCPDPKIIFIALLQTKICLLAFEHVE